MDLPRGLTEVQIGACLSASRQELIVLPTEKCNFRCTYCYEDFAIGKMSRSVIDGIKRLIDRRAKSLEVLSLSWFGGEPLLAADVILEISRHAYQKSLEAGFALRGGMTTNGYLLSRQLAEELLSLDQDFFQISLDGWQEGHDVTRKLANGRGTFDRVWSNVLGLAQLPRRFEVVLRLHISRSNVASLETLCRRIASTVGTDSRFRVDFQDIRDMGGPRGESVTHLTAEELRERTRQLSRILNPSGDGKTRVSSKLDNVGESAGGRPSNELVPGGAYICYASKPNSLLIRANGRLGKCTVALNSEANDIGQILEDGSLVLNNPKLRRWLHGFETLSLDALGCPLHSLPQNDIGDGVDSSRATASRRDAFPVSIRVESAAGLKT